MDVDNVTPRLTGSYSAYLSSTPGRDTTSSDGRRSSKRKRGDDDGDDGGGNNKVQVIHDESSRTSETATAKSEPTSTATSPPPATPVNRKGTAFEIRIPPLANPKSVFGLRSAKKEREEDILASFLSQEEESDDDEEGTGYIEYRIEDFSIYTGHDYIPCRGGEINPFRYPYELIAPSALNITNHISYLYVDGFLTNDQGERRYVQRMQFDTLAVNYTGEFEKPVVWIQSNKNSALSNPKNTWCNSKLDRMRGSVFYSLGKPSPEYASYYSPFLWVTVLGVFVFDYLSGKEGDVMLECFRKDFSEWLERTFREWKFESQEKRQIAGRFYRRWLDEYGRTDFRTAVAGHKDWLWNQLHGLYHKPQDRMRNLTLWKEIHTLDAIPNAYSGAHEELTVVTPYVYNIFKSMYGNHLKKIETPDHKPKSLAGVFITKSPKARIRDGPYVPMLGDIVAFRQDEESKWTKHQKNSAGIDAWEGFWFGWVTKIQGDTLGIVWLYRPRDTILYKSEYPYKNELFFSDHCNCGDDPLHTRDIEDTVSATFHPSEDEMETAEFFVRQTYRTDDPAFLTLTKSELELGRCPCAREKEFPEGSFEEVRKGYAVGDAVLYSRPRHDLLEPGIIVEFNEREKLVHVRSLKRRDPHEAGAAPNELYFAHKVEAMRPGNIKRHCFIRQFDVNQEIEAPYNRGGIGDCFFIRHEINNEETLTRPLTRKLRGDELRQGFRVGDAESQKPVLRGMDLFCGGGNFGRGLEEGGAVEMKWAVDFDSGPLHTYRANMRTLDETTLYLGSINNYLADVIQGKYSGRRGIPNREEVDFISAGSPCQGFSNANSNHKNSEGSLRKQSLVCSLATAIDLYRPKYAVLENVREIATNRKDKDGNEVNTYCTMLTSIVGLGYQVQSFISDAWSYGNCQSRTRLILCISKAGLKPLARPPRSHAHDPKHVRALNLYTAPNGQSFGQRETDGPTPFPFMSVHRGWSHLPYIGDGHVSINVRYPDHATGALPQDTTTRLLMSTIPRFGAMNSWYEAIKTGRLHKEIQMYEIRGEKDNYFCRTFSRIPSDGLCRTITTSMTPHCTRTGRWVHPDQNRLITVQEARIAQGFPDNEVLIGPLNKRLHVVGNSVARGASMAIGIALRKAYFGNPEE